MNGMGRWMMKASLWFAMAAPCLAVNTQAASFDCAKASTKVEKAICADEELSKLDEDLGKAYSEALPKAPDPESLKQQQKQWLRERNKCSDTACLKQAYQTRLSTLVKAPTTAQTNEAEEHVLSGANTKKPLYGHCVDLTSPRNCGPQSGKGYDVCESYLNYLNTLDQIPTCEVVVPPGFQRPNWQELNVMEHLDWAYQAEMIAHGDYQWFIKDYPDEATWREKFLGEIRLRAISPVMRTTKVRPIKGGEEITILAYTRNIHACLDVVQRKYDGSFWAGVGYVHSRILDEPNLLPVAINGTSMSFQTELLLYKGDNYFIWQSDPVIFDKSDIRIYGFYQNFLQENSYKKYWSEQRCSFRAVEQKFRFK